MAAVIETVERLRENNTPSSDPKWRERFRLSGAVGGSGTVGEQGIAMREA